MAYELSDFDDDVATATAPRTGGDIELKDLKDGEYAFKVVALSEKRIGAGPVVSLTLEVTTDCEFVGSKLVLQYWLCKKTGEKDQVKYGILIKDLERMGFDAKEWKRENGRPFAAEFPRAAKAAPGLFLAAAKKTNNGYANLYVNGRLPGDGLPERFTPADLVRLAAEYDERHRDPFGGD